MKVRIQKASLLQGVQTVIKAVSSKATMPILSGIKLESREGKIRLFGNDLEMGIECEAPAEEILEEGQVVVPGKAFQDIVRKLPDTSIELESKDNEITIRYYFSEIVLKGFDPEEFPIMPTLEGERINIPANAFKAMVRQTIFAVATEENRPVFTGVLLECENGDLKVVATDTHRLAFSKSVGLIGSEGNWKVVIPARALNEVLRLVPDDELLGLMVTESQALFSFRGITLVTRLVDGAFPDYMRIIPQTEKSKAVIKGKPLLEAIERASSVVERTGLKFTFGNRKLEINAQANSGKVREELEVSLDGQDVQVVFNQKFFSDVLKAVNHDEYTLSMNGEFGAGIVRPVGADNYLYLMLPMRGVA